MPQPIKTDQEVENDIEECAQALEKAVKISVSHKMSRGTWLQACMVVWEENGGGLD